MSFNLFELNLREVTSIGGVIQFYDYDITELNANQELLIMHPMYYKLHSVLYCKIYCTSPSLCTVCIVWSALHYSSTLQWFTFHFIYSRTLITFTGVE